MENIKEIQILLDLQGEPVHEGDVFLSTSHGYYAYVSESVDTFVYRLFREMSIWDAPTNSYITRDRHYFSLFELDCGNKAFLKSRTFKKICEHYNAKFVILDNGENDAKIAREFFGEIRS